MSKWYEPNNSFIDLKESAKNFEKHYHESAPRKTFMPYSMLKAYESAIRWKERGSLALLFRLLERKD